MKISELKEGYALVLENGFTIDIPEELTELLKKQNVLWQWYDMREKFWPENKKETIEFFSELPEGQVLYCNTVFNGFQQLELMLQLLHKLKDKKFTLHIQNPSLCDNLYEFYEEKESSITPKELEKKLDEAESDEAIMIAFEEIYNFKKKMNKTFEEVLAHHNIFWLSDYGDKTRLATIEDIKNNRWDK